MWIAKINIGLRRFGLFVIITLFIAAIINSYLPFIAYLIVGGVLSISAIMMYFLYSFGMFQRKYQFRNLSELKEVRDYTNFRNPKENYRCICPADSRDVKSYDSKIYLNTNEKWAHFDILRIILISLAAPPKKILILGAGGGSLLHTLTRSFPNVHIDAVESSKKMVGVAKDYFLAIPGHPRILWFHQDALLYLRKCNTLELKYDCIIVDLALDSRAPQGIYKRPFITSLRKAMGQHSVIFINFIHMNHVLYRSVFIYRSIFSGFKCYRYYNNYIGTNYNLPKSIPSTALVA